MTHPDPDPTSAPRPPGPPRKPSRPSILPALVFAIALVGVAYWLITAVHDWDRLQTCALSGRRDCAAPR
ncbi:hypothetical protein EYW49_14680 [Siculibacillus lacustris]|uniref:DUF2125 domain-containing protein n=1 Tax=Siculibacillus lacustris TaxID=1549641 RepID=A0A4Q9VKW6_9HYPH|nr:hypothetical protein [Siculibacillus lacustris]TBW36092.1 hypothetical protein EYW49_14680 [Siculibacillus lacustris]